MFSRTISFNKKLTALIIFCCFFIASCNQQTPDKDQQNIIQSDFQNTLIEKLIDAKPGDVIEIPEGIHQIDRSLSLRVDNVTIRGAGMDKTVLSFKGQKQGAEGLLVNANNFVIEDLTMQDTIGDTIKISNGENVIIRRVKVEWTNGPDTKNGAYGLYPVKIKNVLIEDSVAIGASDAGIYVGQSNNVVIRRNRAEYNVAGIEIENTVGADVYENIATNNTGGILVFNMPGLSQAGGKTRVYDNQIFSNNTENFGHKGTPVASVPAGSGVVINSNDLVEIFNNKISNNNTSNIIVSSLFETGYADREQSESFDPYPESIYIYDNEMADGGKSPDFLPLKLLKTTMFGLNGALPDVLWDGYIDQAKFVDNKMPEHLRICVNNGDAQVLNADSPNNNKNPRVEDKFQCDLAKLPKIELTDSFFN